MFPQSTRFSTATHETQNLYEGLTSRLENQSIMKKIMATFSVAAALVMPITLMAQDHHDQGYYDAHHKDYHQWNGNEDRAYHMYWEQNHRTYVDWNHATPRQQQAYWDWRHHHSDALLQINVR